MLTVLASGISLWTSLVWLGAMYTFGSCLPNQAEAGWNIPGGAEVPGSPVGTHQVLVQHWQECLPPCLCPWRGKQPNKRQRLDLGRAGLDVADLTVPC